MIRTPPHVTENNMQVNIDLNDQREYAFPLVARVADEHGKYVLYGHGGNVVAQFDKNDVKSIVEQ